MRSNHDLRQDVEAELRWAPELDEQDIAVNVTDGVVALTGFVRTFLEKSSAEDAAKRVVGVAGVANDLEIRLIAGQSDQELAREAVAALRTQLPFVHETLKIVVRQGRVILEGTVEWNYQRDMAESAVRGVQGVTQIENRITVRPRVAPADLKHEIERAFRRSAQVDAEHISVEIDGSKVTLRGKVPSWAERNEAERTVWSAPGITHVENEIVVGL